ncbi:MAG: hypothetical protein JRL30_11030 [Deltaproteobacteria bacterium]|nr:hypothetical protein [Deltaproteobacteria bacterium]
MQEYWDMISTRHQQKLLAVAKKKGIGLDTAMRNIINYLRNNDLNPNRPEYFKEFITARHVEGMIDMIVL